MNRRPGRQLLVAVGVAAVIGTAILVGVRVGVPGVAALRAAFSAHRWWTPLLFIAVYALVTLTPLPKAVFSLAAGASFGIALALPVGGHSGRISNYVAPILRTQALAAQSAAIDGVSGATYTSRAYAASLQGALDQAGL